MVFSKNLQKKKFGPKKLNLLWKGLQVVLIEVCTNPGSEVRPQMDSNIWRGMKIKNFKIFSKNTWRDKL